MLYVVRLPKISGSGTKLTFSLRKRIEYGVYSRDVFCFFGTSNIETSCYMELRKFFEVKKIYPKISSYIANNNFDIRPPDGLESLNSAFLKEVNKYFNSIKTPTKVFLEVKDAS